MLVSSSRSLARPTTTTALAWRTFILTAMMPPQTAFFWPSGCLMMTTVPGRVMSAQWTSLGMLAGGESSVSPLRANRTVDAGAMVMGASAGIADWPSSRRSGRKPAPGTLSLTRASDTSHAVYFRRAAMRASSEVAIL